MSLAMLVDAPGPALAATARSRDVPELDAYASLRGGSGLAACRTSGLVVMVVHSLKPVAMCARRRALLLPFAGGRAPVRPALRPVSAQRT